MQIYNAIQNGKKILRELQISNAENEAIWLMEKVLNTNSSNLLFNKSKLTTKNKISYFNMIKRRGNGEPFQLINQKCDFYGRTFKVKKNIFIPRQDTEKIIDISKTMINKGESILEVGTGTGCIAITLALECDSINIVATDINQDAIILAKKNIKKYSINNIKFIYDNILDSKINKTFDMIISNPPYIPYNEIKDLPNEVKNFDPKNALTDFDDGFKFYNMFAKIGQKYLSKKGKMLFEIGDTLNINILKKIFNCYQDFQIYKDFNNINRFIKIIK